MKKFYLLSLITLLVATVGFSQITRDISPKADNNSAFANKRDVSAFAHKTNSDVRITGDDCTDAFIVAAAPATETGTAIETFTNVYGLDSLTTWGHMGADVVYSYTCTVDEVLTAVVSGDFDQAFSVFTDCVDPIGSVVGAADANLAAPFTETLTVNAVTGTTYFFVVGSYVDTVGGWTFTLDAAAPCVDALVAVGDSEIEPNGGINETPIQYDPRTLGTAAAPTQVTGFLETVGGARDMDWFDVVLTDYSTITATVDIMCGDVAIFIGNEDMSTYESVNDNGAEMGETMTTALLAPGNYWIVIAPPTFDDLAIFGYNLELSAETGTTPVVGESFENAFPPVGWTTVNADGDAFDWEQGAAPGISAQEGDYCATSASWDQTAGPLNPDNWLITYPFMVAAGDVASWYVAAQDPAYAAEKYAVMISTATDAIADFTITLHEETLVDEVYAQHEYDLSAYAGQVLYLAFRHYDVTDMYQMKIDNVMIPAVYNANAEVNTNAIAVYPNPVTNNLFVGNAANSTISVFNILGEEVANVINAGQLESIDMSSLTNGTYFVKVYADNNVTTRKVVLNR